MREKLETVKETFKETAEIFKAFVKRLKVEDEILEVPKQLKKTGNTLELFNLLSSLVTMAFSFLLSMSNTAIEARFIFLGVVLFMLYRSESLVREITRMYNSVNREKNELILKNELTLRGGMIQSKVSGKVMKYDSERKLYQLMEKEEILNCVKRYLEKFWEAKIGHKFQIVEIISVIVMLVMAVKTNKELPQGVFMFLLAFFGVVSIISATHTRKSNKKYFDELRELDDKQSVILNDLLRVPEIIGGRDGLMRISMLKETIEKSNENTMTYNKELNINNIVNVLLELLSHYGIIILYLTQVEWNSISLATIAQITATLAVTERALSYIGRISRSLGYHSELINGIEKEESTLKEILKVFRSEEERLSNPAKIEDLVINPFEIGYREQSENDKPFTLELKSPLEIKKGAITILNGASGSGKSTFMKLISQRIRLENSDEIPSTSRFMYYDETLRFGSLSIFEELFCCSENPDFAKMERILRNLKLWEELSRNCHDVWQWMKEKKFSDSLSNGQKQRLILAKMLYWIDSEIDVCIFDEATSGLDDTELSEGAEASAILEYLANYVNADCKRTVFISTHQNIDEFIRKMKESGYEIVILNFRRQGKFNIVERVG